MASNTLKLIKDKDVKWVDLRFTDLKGKEQHTTVPADRVSEETFEDGVMFDGSSIAGWKAINESDMILMPDDETPVIDPFRDETTLNLRCDIIEPGTMQPYNRDPRSLAKLAEAYVKSSGIGDAVYFGPEAEFFVFDDVRWKVFDARLVVRDLCGRSRMGIEQRIRRPQPRSPPGHQGRLLSRAARRLGGRSP